MSDRRFASRRSLLKRASVLATAGFGGPFQLFAARLKAGEDARRATDFGPLEPVHDLRTGLPLLRLPAGFTYTTFGWEGDPLTEGGITPPAHDGMTCIKQEGALVTLCRNHEVDGADGSFGPQDITYDSKASAGCTNLVFDLSSKRLLRSWASLAGTSRNCAGGATPWGTWITCEETVSGPGSKDRQGNVLNFAEEHGWTFEVPADLARAPKPIKAMGRFTHEAIAIDPGSGIVYQSEDLSACGFYRYVPHVQGKLASGGKLEMMRLGIQDTRQVDTVNRTFDVAWVDIADPEAGLIQGELRGFKPEQGVFRQGSEQGGATFAGLEGTWFADGKVFFTAKSGGPAQKGQIWQYSIDEEKLRLVYVSKGRDDLNMPDNICASPRGGMVVCEDGDEGDPPMRIQYLTSEGLLAPFCINNIDLNGSPVNGFRQDFRDSEWAGATFSGDGTTLFVNIQRPGMSVAITGPWKQGLL